MKVLISVRDREEADIALKAGVDILDIKEPMEGSLGAPSPQAIKQVVDLARNKVEVSAAIGDLDYKPNQASLAALATASLGVDYIKLGMRGISSLADGIALVKQVKEALSFFNLKPKLVIASYGDYVRAGTLNPKQVLKIAETCEADFFMLDTYIKDGKSLLSFTSLEQLKELIAKSHGLGLKIALAGSLSLDDALKLKPLEPDVLGFRKAACSGNRLDKLSLIKARELVEKLRS
ncbi:MAG: hypothetical protein DRJ31_02470 [Candidatus Methanomethylicota archaeon]|uniref:(5-formylfuran-3-yl)methyl phosphate synthase n=1 Tax=Thermoproteota archaeon TaxID=2056631 RepID=A0A497ETQ8_9CREN|nr:MAG: hypothetical protein DRJ31_02470 [Candidatus Verstraetearchaeota archaeon]